jgi:Phage MuF-C-terminal domain
VKHVRGGNLVDQDIISWSRVVDAIVRGDKFVRPTVRIGHTPLLLRRYGLAPVELIMSAAKIAKVRREHPEISLDIWHRLPALLADPLVVIPSMRRDGSLVVVLVVSDADGSPIIVPIACGIDGGPNAVLSMYGKESGQVWIRAQIKFARQEGIAVYEKKGSADSLPQPGSAEAIPWSPDLIPVDRSTEPRREILKLSVKVKLNP